MTISQKIFNLTTLKKFVLEAKEKNKVIVSTNGCFDIIHRGHVEYLEKAKNIGDLLIVGINSDASVKKLKGPTRPLNNQNDRARVLAALESVDCVCVFDEDTPIEFLKSFQPSIHVKGGDYKVEQLPETKVLNSWNAKVVILPFVEGYSTSEIIEKSKKRSS
jgi:glycerol-3-phosphate cytidylyltransferase